MGCPTQPFVSSDSVKKPQLNNMFSRRFPTKGFSEYRVTKKAISPNVSEMGRAGSGRWCVIRITNVRQSPATTPLKLVATSMNPKRADTETSTL
mmetsp:Transcript_1238/g.3592  ORF Transcript_1238/g.3592 Transcript_1238/m.3592 type:complete len:94 (-) Transcript_1238:1734-2015(-)